MFKYSSNTEITEKIEDFLHLSEKEKMRIIYEVAYCWCENNTEAAKNMETVHQDIMDMKGYIENKINKIDNV